MKFKIKNVLFFFLGGGGRVGVGVGGQGRVDGMREVKLL